MLNIYDGTHVSRSDVDECVSLGLETSPQIVGNIDSLKARLQRQIETPEIAITWDYGGSR